MMVNKSGVNIGGGSVAVETLRANLKKALEPEGAATLDRGSFSPFGSNVRQPEGRGG